MPKGQATTTITVDGTVFAVESMKDEVKNLVHLMDEWRQRDADLLSDITMVRSALRDVQNNIYVAIKKQMEEAAKTDPAPQGQVLKPELQVVTAEDQEVGD